jgi:hypothetical protein
MGCSGGWYYWAWSYAETKALMEDKDYPYTSGESALVNTKQRRVKLLWLPRQWLTVTLMQ